MSTSFVEFRGRGFWSWDRYLEHVLALLADGIGSSPDEEWLRDLRDHWRAQSSGDFRSLIDADLDEFVVSDERRNAVLTLLKRVAAQPDLTLEAEQTMRLFELLLRGELQTDDSSPLDYMVSGKQPYKW